MATIQTRLAALERARTADEPAPLLVIQQVGRSNADLIAVSGLEHLPRMIDETGEAYLARLQAHVFTTRSGPSPFIGFASYGDDPADGFDQPVAGMTMVR